MRYSGLPAGMWALFRRSFRFNLSAILGLDGNEAKAVTRAAESRYKEIITKLPEFEREDRFIVNIVNCAMFSAFCLELPERPPRSRGSACCSEKYIEALTRNVLKKRTHLVII